MTGEHDSSLGAVRGSPAGAGPLNGEGPDAMLESLIVSVIKRRFFITRQEAFRKVLEPAGLD